MVIINISREKKISIVTSTYPSGSYNSTTYEKQTREITIKQNRIEIIMRYLHTPFGGIKSSRHIPRCARRVKRMTEKNLKPCIGLLQGYSMGEYRTQGGPAPFIPLDGSTAIRIVLA